MADNGFFKALADSFDKKKRADRNLKKRKSGEKSFSDKIRDAVGSKSGK